MTAVGRKNLKEQAKEPVPVEEKINNETTEVEENDVVEEPENIEAKENDVVEEPENIEAKENDIVEEPETVETEENDIVEEPETVETEEIELAAAGKRKTKKALKAIIHILYNGRIYEPQEELPVDNAEMVEAWTDAGTAIWD